MAALKIILMILQMLCGVFLIVIIMLQSGKNSGLSGVVGGQSAGSMGFQAKSKTWDARFARMTKWVALAFVVLTFILVLL